MTIMEISILVIAIINVVLMIAMVMMLLRVKNLLTSAEDVVKRHGVPLIEKLNAVADDVKNISRDARQVEQRLAGAASKVMDQVEPPIRHFAALLAGMRAGVGKIFDASHPNSTSTASNGYATVHQKIETRKE